MNEWWLLICFMMLILLVLPVVLYPLRKTAKWISILLTPLLIVALSVAYWCWGAWPAWQQYVHNESKQQQVQAIMQTVKSPNQIIDKLKARLKEDPESARGWYLLGRLYASQNKWLAARDAFAKSMQLNSEDEAATLNYAQSLWQLNEQQFDEPIRAQFKTLLQKNPNQPDALAMLAMDAFVSQNYKLAINYWQHLLKLAPEQSEEAQMIRKAIAKAQQKL